MSNPQLNDPSRNWYITAEKVSTSTTGTNLTLDASVDVNIFSGTGPTGSIYLNTNAWFDGSANLNFAFGRGTYENAVQTSTSSATLALTSSDLYKTFPFNPAAGKIIQMPAAATCKIGSWIEITNFSTTSNVTIQDSTGALVYTILYPSIAGTVGGSGVRMVAVSSTGQTGSGFANNWVCGQSGAAGPTGATGPLIQATIEGQYLIWNQTNTGSTGGQWVIGSDNSYLGVSNVNLGAYSMENAPVPPIGTNVTRNVAVGTNTLRNIAYGFDNVAVGYNAIGSTGITGNIQYNTAVGSQALANMAVDSSKYPDSNTAVGYSSLNKTTNGQDNTAIGAQSMTQNTSGDGNVAVGFGSLTLNITGSNNIAIGFGALYGSTSANDTVAVGANALSINNLGERNTAVGTSSMYKNVNGSDNVALGYYALYGDVGGSNAINNTAIGTQSLMNVATNGDNNTAVGAKTMQNNTTGRQNTALGWNSLNVNVTGNNNVALGHYSLPNVTTDFNTAVGSSSLSNSTTGTENTALGFFALGNSINGNANVALGYLSGSNNIGSNNTLIGANTQTQVNTDGNTVVIGSSAVGAGSNTTVIKQLRDADATVMDGPIPDAQYSNYAHYNPTTHEVTYIPEVLYVSTPTYTLTPGASNQQLTIIDNISGAAGQDAQFLQFAEAAGTVSQGNSYDVYALATDGGSNIFVGGQIATLDGNACGSIATFSTTGVYQNNLNGGFDDIVPGVTPATVKSIYYDLNNARIYAGGRMITINGGVTHINCISYYNIGLGAWQQMGNPAYPGYPGVNNSFSVFAITSTSPSSNIYIGGDFPNNANGALTFNNICCYEAGTDTLSALQGITYGVTQVSSPPVVNAVRVIGNYIYVGGIFKSAGGVQANNVARYDLSYNIWEALWDSTTNRNGVEGRVYAISLDNGGNIYVGGNITTVGGKTCSNNLAYWNPTLAIWYNTSSGGPNDTVYALAIADTSGIGNNYVMFIGGGFTSPGKSLCYYDLQTTGYSDLGGTNGGQGTDGTVFALTFADLPSAAPDNAGLKKLYFGGAFNACDIGSGSGDTPSPNIGVWTWGGYGYSSTIPLNNGTNSTVKALTYCYGPSEIPAIPPTLYVGGDFTSVNYLDAGSISVRYIAQYDITTTMVVPWQGLYNDTNNDVNNQVFALTINRDGATGAKLVIGGSFTQCNNNTVTANRIVHFKLYSVAGFETLSQNGGNGVNSPVRAVGYTFLNSPYPTGQTTIMGGDFTLMDYNGSSDLSANLVGMYTYTTPTFNQLAYISPSVGVGLTASTSSISALKMIGTDLYVGGNFDSAGPNHTVSLLRNPNVYNIAKWDTIDKVWYPVVTASLTAPGVGLDGAVLTLETDGTKLYVGGGFTNTGKNASIVLNYVGAWDTASADWFQFVYPNISSPTDLGFNNSVKNLYYNSGTLYTTGTFTQTNLGILSCNAIASLNTSLYEISAIVNTSPPLTFQNGFKLTTGSGLVSGNAILYLNPNIYFGGLFDESAPTTGYPFSRTSYFVPFIAPIPDQVTISAAGCSFLDTDDSTTYTQIILPSQYKTVMLIYNASINKWLETYRSSGVTH